MTHTLPTTSAQNYGPLYWVAGKDQKADSRIFKAAVFNSTADVPVSVSFEGVKSGTKAQLTILTGPSDPYGINDPFTRVNVVKSSTQELTASENGTFKFSLPGLSVSILDTGAVGGKKDG